MQTIRTLEKTDKHGSLLLRIPLSKPETEYEVVVVVQPTGVAEKVKREEGGWPPGYFENTFGSITDPTFERAPQGELPPPLDLDMERVREVTEGR